MVVIEMSRDHTIHIRKYSPADSFGKIHEV